MKGLAGQISRFCQSRQPFDELVIALKTLKHKKGSGPYKWEIPLGAPLRTRATDAYKRGSGNRHKVVGEISTVWWFKPLARGRVRVENASTRVRVLKASDTADEPVAEWQMDVAAGEPPGCFFHAQLGPPVPDWLEVPRLPFAVPTLSMVVEFVLGELFQTEWVHYMQKQVLTPNMAQRRIVHRWLEWQRDAVTSGSGSSWLALKRAVPTPNTFR